MILLRPGFDSKILDQKIDKCGRYIIIEVEIEQKQFVLMNIYAPNKDHEKRDFFQNVNNILQGMNIAADRSIISGGDWNSIFDENLDKSGGQRHASNIVLNDMQAIINDHDLIDIWRIRNPTSKRFTFRQKTPLVQTRLDYFLVSDHCQDLILGTDIIPSVWSDHSAIVLQLKFLPEWPKGNGHWKFNAKHLEDDFVECMNDKLDEWLMLYSNVKDIRVQWDLIKYEIRRYCMKYGKLKKGEQNVYTGNLLQKLNMLEIKLGQTPSEQNKQEYGIVGVVLLTIGYHVPRNDKLDGLDPNSAEGIAYWATYLEEWVRMNHVRTIAPLVTAVLLTVSLRVE